MSLYSSVYFVICLQITFVFCYTVLQVFKICYLFNNIIVYQNFDPLYVLISVTCGNHRNE